MITLVLLTLLVMGFILLATRNWKSEIQAGLTILIIGTIILVSFGTAKWNQYQEESRIHDLCKTAVEQSNSSYTFNLNLIQIVKAKFPDDSSLTSLQEIIPQPLDLADCPSEPSMFNIFDSGE